MAAPKKCELKGCKEFLGPGSAAIGYVVDGQTYEVKACPFHTGIIQTAGPGVWTITKDRELKPIPASFFIKKGRP
jgi:hypothetical protein